MRSAIPISLLPVLLLLNPAGCGDSQTGATTTATETEAAVVRGAEPKVQLPKGKPPRRLVVRDLEKGNGPVARPGDKLTTQFIAVRVTGKRFESTWDSGRKPFSFRLGAEESSPGWERGLRGMRVGGRRELIVPPELSSRFGTPPESTPQDTLVYVIDLLAIDRPPAAAGGEPSVQAPNGAPPQDLVVADLVEGAGPVARRGDELTVEYVGIHYDGSSFTNSWQRSKPFVFELGGGSPFVNPGWERGIPGMRVGGRRKLIVPPKLLQRGGAPPGSKPSDTLVYVVDLISASTDRADRGELAVQH